MNISLAAFGAKPVFEHPRSTSNLVGPDKSQFLKYLKSSYDTGSLIGNSELILKLEERLSKLHGSKYCISVCNGLWGLVLAINELRLEGKNEIIMPSLTYRRMADIAAWLRMTPHFCDVDIKTLGITGQIAERCINNNTALILAPHPIVNLCDVEGIIKLAKQYKLPLLFDSVEASYADVNNQPIGSFGNAECFSVHASKFLNGFEGGYITTNDPDLAKRLRAARDFGIDANGELITMGIGGRMIDMHAAMTMACLDQLDDQIEKNKRRFYKYKECLNGIDGIELIEYSNLEKRSFKNIVVKLNSKWPLNRNETITVLQKENMVVRPYYYPPLHEKKSTYKVVIGDMTNTTELMENHLLLPCGEFVDESDIEIIVSYLKYLHDNADEVREKLKNIIK